MYKKVLEKLTFNYCDLSRNAKINYATAILKNLKEKGVSIDDETYKKVSQLIYKSNSTTSSETKHSSNDGSKKYYRGGHRGNYKGNDNKHYKTYNNFNK